MLLRDGEVAEPARLGLVVWIRNTRGHGTSTGGLLNISHGNDGEEGGDNEEATGSGGVWWGRSLVRTMVNGTKPGTVRRKYYSNYIPQAALQNPQQIFVQIRQTTGRAVG